MAGQSAVKKTSIEDLAQFLKVYDQKRAALGDDGAALQATADESGLNIKTAKERWESLHTTLDVWDAFESGRLSYSKLKLFSTLKLSADQANALLATALQQDLAVKDITALRKKILSC